MPAGFSASDLKRIAMGTMLVDHAAVALLYRNGSAADPYWSVIYTAMRLVGRVAFPLFAFLLAEGALYTKSRRNYAARLFLAAVASEIPYDLVNSGRIWDPESQNILWLLLTGLLVITAAERTAWRRTVAGHRSSGAVLLTAAAVLTGMAAVLFLRADYGLTGLLFLLSLYFLRGCIRERMIAAGILLILSEGVFYGTASWIAFFFMNRYNGEKGRLPGLFAYVFYPAHLLILHAAGV